MKYFVLIIAFVSLDSANSVQQIKERIESYFKSGTIQEFYNTWQKQRRSFDTGVATNLKESYGVTSGAMNEMKRLVKDPQELTTGYLFSDEIVTVLLVNLYLREIPRLLMPDVSFNLPHDVLRLETPLSKMFLDSDYVLFRNKTDIVYDDTDPVHSPFSYQQVKKTGKVTIVAEDCHLIGEAVVTLAGVTPHVGYSNFKVVNCKFSIEIYQPGTPAPPIIAPYFNKEQVDELQKLMSPPINEEAQSKAQAAIVSLCNNSAILGDEMQKVRYRQITLFDRVKEYVSDVVRYLNKAIVEKNQGIVPMEGLSFYNDGKYKISNVTLNGLDLAYSTSRGGPIKMAGAMIVEELRFYRIQVRGQIECKLNNGQDGEFSWAVEIQDIPVGIKIVLNGKDYTGKEKFVVKPWRDHSYVSFVFNDELWNHRLKAYNLITGYLVTAVPKTLTKHMADMFEDAVKKAEAKNDREHYDKLEPSSKE